MPPLPAVVMDERGYLRIVGRIKDIIIRGGENISPREVEEFLYTHPAILVCTAHMVRCTAAYILYCVGGLE
jgi:acyl-CoA synthetase (AMP-forming)/AMP-acid ligase II